MIRLPENAKKMNDEPNVSNENSTRFIKYPYIAIEGVNLSGKSTAVNFVKEHSKYKDNIAVYHEPDENTLLGKFIRENVSKENKINDFVVKNALYLLGIKENTFTSFKDHKVHLSSRSALSNIVYSDLNTRTSVNIIKVLKVKIPDLTIMINASDELLAKRLDGSNERDIAESKGIRFLIKKQERMRQLILYSHLFKNSVILNVDIDNENINEKILKLVDEEINKYKSK